ncbi:MAG: hypothetical protein JRJ38_10110 [Deltaproteobacteria bacterium]|nr:hypothetical protein [Deltaproteobacteria bacterium]
MEELKALFLEMSPNQKQDFVSGLRALLESTEQKLAYQYDNGMTKDERLQAISESMGLRQLIYSVKTAQRKMGLNPNENIEEFWAELSEYVGSK